MNRNADLANGADKNGSKNNKTSYNSLFNWL